MEFISEKRRGLASYTGGYVLEHFNFCNDLTIMKLFELKQCTIMWNIISQYICQ